DKEARLAVGEELANQSLLLLPREDGAHCVDQPADLSSTFAAPVSATSSSTEKPAIARTRSARAISSSRRWLAGSEARSFSGSHRWRTPVAKFPSLRRMPLRNSRIMRSESSSPQPV